MRRRRKEEEEMLPGREMKMGGSCYLFHVGEKDRKR